MYNNATCSPAYIFIYIYITLLYRDIRGFSGFHAFLTVNQSARFSTFQIGEAVQFKHVFCISGSRDKKINTMTKNERFEIRLSLALADENLPDTQT